MSLFLSDSTPCVVTLSLHDALPILIGVLVGAAPGVVDAHRVVGGNRAVEKGPPRLAAILLAQLVEGLNAVPEFEDGALDRKSTRLNSSHTVISYAVFCLKKKKKNYV